MTTSIAVRRRRPLLAIAVCALALGVTACGSSSKSASTDSSSKGSSSSTTTDSSSSSSNGSGSSSGGLIAEPCKLVTQEQAAAALGEAVNPGKAGPSPTAPACDFSAVSGHSVSDAVIVQSQQPYIFDGTLKGKDNSQVQAMFTIQEVSGLGDQAYYQISKSSASAPILLGVKKDGKVIFISVHNSTLSQDQIKAAEKTLAEQAVKNM